LLLPGKASKQFFFEKKNQKTLAHSGRYSVGGYVAKGRAFAGEPRDSQKFFGSFFQKRTAFLRLTLTLQ